jgi:hypothetical protein
MPKRGRGQGTRRRSRTEILAAIEARAIEMFREEIRVQAEHLAPQAEIDAGLWDGDDAIERAAEDLLTEAG